MELSFVFLYKPFNVLNKLIMKEIFRITFSILFIVLLTTTFCGAQSLQDSLLIHYKFDGDSLDYSGNNYDPMFFQASFTDDINGNPNSALYFNGIDDYIILPDKDELRPDFPMTISFWIKMDNLSPENNVFFTNDFNMITHSGVWLNLNSYQKMALSFGDGSGFYPYSRKSKLTNISLQQNEWYFVAGVIWNEDDMRIYINGMEEYGYTEGGATHLTYAGTPGNIGRKDGNYLLDPYYFKGCLDDFRYWNRGLTDEEIFSLYDMVVDINTKPSESLISIYPNPASDFINIRAGVLNETKFQVKIYNILGEHVLTQDDSNKLNIQALPKGIYFIHVNNGAASNEIYSFKFIKN